MGKLVTGKYSNGNAAGNPYDSSAIKLSKSELSLDQLILRYAALLEKRLKDLELALQGPNPPHREFQVLSARLGLCQAYSHCLGDLELATDVLQGNLAPSEKKVAFDLKREIEIECERQKKLLLDKLLSPVQFADASALVSLRLQVIRDTKRDFVEDLYSAYVGWLRPIGYEVQARAVQRDEQRRARTLRFLVEGQGAFDLMRHEAGVHYFEAQTQFSSSERMVTPEVSVLVVPGTQAAATRLKNEEIEISHTRGKNRSSTHANKDYRAVHMLHKPTGLRVTVQEQNDFKRSVEMARDLLSQKVAEQQLAGIEQQQEIITQGQHRALRVYKAHGRVVDSRFPTEILINTDDFFKGKISDLSFKIRLFEFCDRIKQEIDHLS